VVALALVVLLVGVLVAERLFSDGDAQSPVATPAGDASSAPGRPVVRPVAPDPTPVPEDALADIRFEDVTTQVGLTGSGPDAPEPTAADMDAGAAVADIDDDGDLDLLLSSSGRASGLHRNDGGVFTDITEASGLPPLTAVTSAAFADVDADGHLDLFLGGPSPDFGRLFVQDGSGRFRDRTRAWGVTAPVSGQRAIRGVDFGDVDRDGDLDLLVTDWNIGSFVAVEVALGDAPDRFTGQCHYAATVRRLHAAGTLKATGATRAFRNDGDRFTDATREWGLADLGIERPFTPQLVDLDDDGWLDLAVAGDSCSSRLYRNDEGTGFVDVTQQAGVGTDENGMGSIVRDLDGDTRPDWLVTSISYPTADRTCPPVGLFAGCSGNRVYLNRGRMRFEEVSDELGLRDTGWGWGAVAADFGNDGRLQVVVTNGRIGKADPDPTSQVEVYYAAFVHDETSFWVRLEDGVYADAAAQVGIDDDRVSHALVAFDHDRDGRLDLLVAHAGAPPTLYRNLTPPRRWIGIRLRDPSTPGNASALGSRVEVTTTAGGTTTQWLHTSGSYEAQHPAELHVGLGDAGVARIRVWWPGERLPQVLTAPPTERIVTITRTG
jgi:hypothetical protein